MREPFIPLIPSAAYRDLSSYQLHYFPQRFLHILQHRFALFKYQYYILRKLRYLLHLRGYFLRVGEKRSAAPVGSGV